MALGKHKKIYIYLCHIQLHMFSVFLLLTKLIIQLEYLLGGHWQGCKALNWHLIKYILRMFCPRFNAFKYDSEGENVEYWVKNIKRVGKTIYEFKVLVFLN